MTKIDDYSISETKDGWKYSRQTGEPLPHSVSGYATWDEALAALAEDWADRCEASMGSVTTDHGARRLGRSDYVAQAVRYYSKAP